MAIENARLFNETKEALEQQTATSEVLRVISSALTDVQPVFRAILERATRLCGAELAHFWLYEEDGTFSLVESHGSSPEHVEWLRSRRHRFGPPFFRETGPWEAGQIEDIRATEPYRRGDEVWVRSVDNEGMRTLLNVPLVQDGRFIGALSIYRREVRRFAASQVNLVKTFADQAVIAIENVRLFTELQEKNRALTQAHKEVTHALEQQTATGEILRVISSSPTDVQPVFDAIAQSAAVLCHAPIAGVFRYDGELVHFVATNAEIPAAAEAGRRSFPMRADADVLATRAIAECRVVHLADVLEDRARKIFQAPLGHRSLLSVPMIREGKAVGSINVVRTEVGLFTAQEVALLQTFADQAVIAIENVRLFTELQETNRAVRAAHAQVSEALEQQTATSEILEVMSQSQTDAQPVFEAIVRSALRLCDGFFSIVYRFDGTMMDVAADHQVNPLASAALRALYPAPARRDHIVGRALLDRRRHHIADVATDPGLGGNRNVFMSSFPYRTALAVPMLQAGVPIGAIAIGRSDVRPFTDRQIEVLETFADQAVIAIENVRLFKELEARTAELTRSVEKLTALSEVSQAVSSTLDVETVSCRARTSSRAPTRAGSTSTTRAHKASTCEPRTTSTPPLSRGCELCRSTRGKVR